MRRLISAALLLFSAGSAWSAPAFPETPFSSKSAGTTAAAFLKIPAGARFSAMGEAAAAGASGAEALFWNPAGLARLGADSPSDLQVGYNHWLEQHYLGAAAYAKPTSFGTFAASFLYFSQAAQTSYSAVGDPTGSVQPYDVALSVAYARRFGRILAGAGLKYLRSALPGEQGHAAALDAGFQVLHVTDLAEAPVDFGASVSNLGTPMKISGSSAPLPFRMRAGIYWRAFPFLDAAFDTHFPIDDEPHVSLGVEARAALGAARRWKAAARIGYNQRLHRGIQGFSGMTAGGGLDLARLALDYAWVPFGDLGQTQRVALSLRF